MKPSIQESVRWLGTTVFAVLGCSGFLAFGAYVWPVIVLNAICCIALLVVASAFFKRQFSEILVLAHPLVFILTWLLLFCAFNSLRSSSGLVLTTIAMAGGAGVFISLLILAQAITASWLTVKLFKAFRRRVESLKLPKPEAMNLLVLVGAGFVATGAFLVAAIYSDLFVQHHDDASVSDVRFILEVGHFKHGSIEKVIHSYNAHGCDAYQVQLSHLAPGDLRLLTDENFGWCRGDKMSTEQSSFVKFVSGFHSYIPWFLHSREIEGSNVYMYVERFYREGGRVSMAQVLFVRPFDDMAFYFQGHLGP